MHIHAAIAASTPLIILTTARPALFEHYPNWSANLARTRRLDLKALTRDESRDLVAQILKRVKFLPGALRELVVGGAEGNPFYLEEMIKMLVDGKVIQPSEPEWKVDLERLGTLNIPSTLAGILQARIDGLEAAERAALQRAAIIGRIFWDSAVAALSPELLNERAHLYDALNVLRAKEFVFTNPISTFSGTQEFSFKHALMRDVTYETVLKRQRVQYHALVADWLSKVSGERRGEFLPIIADHYEKAGDVNHAIETLIEAGEQALKVSGFNEAFRFFQRTAQLLPATRPRDHAYIQLKLGEVFQRTGEYNDALKYSLKALDLSRNFTMGNLYAAALYQAGQTYAEMGDYTRAESYFMQALPIARAGARAARETLGKVLYGLGNLSWRLGKLEEARRYCEESSQIATEMHDTNTLLLALNRLAVVKGMLGDTEGEEAGYQQVLDLSIAAGNRERAAVAVNNLGALADERGELEKAQGYYLKAIGLAREIGAQQSLALYLINLAHSEIKLKALDQGKQHLQEGLALASHLGAGPWILTAVMFFARLEAAHGNFDRALRLLGLAEHQHAYSPDHQRLAEQMLKEWNLDNKLIAEKFAEGAKLDWEETLSELLR
jgi:predicted ATPase